MRKAVIIRDKSKYAGTIATSFETLGFPLLGFDDDLTEFDYIIIFHNKLPPKLNTRPDAQIGWWMNDFRHPQEIDETGERNFTHIFLCNTHVLGAYQLYFGRPTFYMPQIGIDRPEKFSRNVRPIDWDVLFIDGSMHPKYHAFRRPYLDAIKNYRLKIIDGEKITTDQFLLYNQTPINLSMTLPLKLTTSNRLYNIISSRGFALVKYFPQMERLFTNGEHLAWFHDIEEMNSLISYYMANPKERERIAKNGYELYKEKHTAVARFGNMLDIMSNKTKEFYGFLK